MNRRKNVDSLKIFKCPSCGNNSISVEITRELKCSIGIVRCSNSDCDIVSERFELFKNAMPIDFYGELMDRVAGKENMEINIDDLKDLDKDKKNEVKKGKTIDELFGKNKGFLEF